MGTPYDHDFYGWANEQAALLRAGRLSEADIANIAEEIESMGRGEKRELSSRLSVLLLHLLKWQYQPDRRGASWEATIRVQRRQLLAHLVDNPSLKPQIPGAIAAAYLDALDEAIGETGLVRDTFPPACPWNWNRIVDLEFWPGTAAN